jgi:hypothetical protein
LKFTIPKFFFYALPNQWQIIFTHNNNTKSLFNVLLIHQASFIRWSREEIFVHLGLKFNYADFQSIMHLTRRVSTFSFNT